MTNHSHSASNQTQSCGTAITADSKAAGLNSRAITALENRGLDIETIVRLGWHSVERGKSGDEWIAIPHFKDSEIVNTKYRTVAGEKHSTTTDYGR